MELSNLPVSKKRASRLLRVSPSYISYLIAEGELDFFLPPGKKQKRIPLESIKNFIEKHTYNNNLKGEE
jgi:excisionase family DNA binding protein